MRGPALILLLALPLAAQEPAQPLALGLSTPLGTDPAELIHLTYPGCWDGLVLSAARPQRTAMRRGTPGATVEVWDLALPESPRREAFLGYWEGLRQRLLEAIKAPPPGHGFIELSEFMASDPSNPQTLDLTKVKSLQERFNRMPPNGSPVRR